MLADRTHDLPEPQPVDALPTVDAVEWGIDRIRADDVWSTFGVRGEGLVVANVDSGVQFDHPALVGRYRGNLGGGSFDHNYNWFDPSHICPTPAPCDNNDHGTHDGHDGRRRRRRQPDRSGARSSLDCRQGLRDEQLLAVALLASGQWIVAPTDLNNQNPRPDLAPDIVNNSWGGPGNDPFYQATVSAWLATRSSRSSPTAATGPAVTRPARPATT